MPNSQSNYRLESHCRLSLLERGGESSEAKGVESVKACTYFINACEGVNFYLTLVYFSALIFKFYRNCSCIHFLLNFKFFTSKVISLTSFLNYTCAGF